MTRARKKILHVLGGLNRGGVETWLLNVCRHIDWARFQMDFLVETTEHCAYDDEIRGLGGRIIPCPHPHQPLTHAREFRRILSGRPSYDVLHSHVHHFSGQILRLAHQAGIPKRIAHSHADTSLRDARSGMLRRSYLSLMRRWIHCYATHGLAASTRSARNLFGDGWEADPRWKTLHCGIELSALRMPVDAKEVRSELGIAPDAFVVGHVGRFVQEKNHHFWLDVAVAVAKREPRAEFLLVGDGPLRAQIARRVSDAGLNGKVKCAGERSDVVRLLRGAVNVFLFPSREEGLGLAVVEAQAAGLPCIVSETIPEEACVVRPLVRKLSLNESAGVWANAVLSAVNGASGSNAEALEAVERSQFNIAVSTKLLERIYES